MNFRAKYPPPLRSTSAQSQPVLIALLCLLSVLGLTLAPVLTGASSTVPADVPLFDPNQYTQQELAASTLNDGIPDVWKLHYGLSITDPAVTNAHPIQRRPISSSFFAPSSVGCAYQLSMNLMFCSMRWSSASPLALLALSSTSSASTIA